MSESEIMPSCNNDQKEKTSIECLQKSIEETQETIRAYDTKAEVLAIVLTLVVGVTNFSVVNDYCKTHCVSKALSLSSVVLGMFTLFAIGMVLYPRKNLFDKIDTGDDKPKGTYFVSLKSMPSFKKLGEYVEQVDATDWKRELAYEVLKTSCIRDHKHFWFHVALRCAFLTISGIIILIATVVFRG